MTDTAVDYARLLRLAASIVSAFVANRAMQSSEVPALIGDVHATLIGLVSVPVEPEPEMLRPAVPIKKSVTSEFLICLEDGKQFKSLKRHLRTRYNMSPDDYRAKWGLGVDYPMVAPAYARERSQLAKEMGLGQQRRRFDR